MSALAIMGAELAWSRFHGDIAVALFGLAVELAVAGQDAGAEVYQIARTALGTGGTGRRQALATHARLGLGRPALSRRRGMRLERTGPGAQ
jgi:hypothetical protein